MSNDAFPEAPRLPFDGAISAYFDGPFPREMRKAVRKAGKNDVVSTTYPHDGRLDRDAYEAEYDRLQIELAKLQAWVRDSGARVALVFEGRDAAGKGGAIKRFRENMNPRVARVVALSKPTEEERGQWYFQRYIRHLPNAGEIVFFDRSWYNRAVVEHVFGFCSGPERARFFDQVPAFEQMLRDDGILLFKIWISVGRAEQMRRMLAREGDPLKQWKLSRIDVDGLARWDAYTAAIGEMFARTHTPASPWHVVRGDGKRRARLAIQRLVLSAIAYDGRDGTVAAPPDPAIAGGPDILPEHDG